nr:ATP synthase subunit delta-like [Nerophis lumbriciformis]
MTLASAAAHRYAEAFVESAAAKGDAALQTLRSELNGLSAAVDESDDLSNLLMNPAFTNDERKKALDIVLDKIGVSTLTKRCLGLLAERDRINELKEIAVVFDEMADARAGREQAFVESATAMPEAAVDQLRRALEKRTGKKIEMNVSVDPSLIGGVRARVGSYVMDGTIKTELTRLRVSLESE